ncbi:MAG: hypothetical protein IJW43_00055 [Clostridia bacterium]|nr:hypothetical protein [Clostridia bacterium]
MDKFIFLTTLRDEKFLMNVSKILFVCSIKGGSAVYFDEYSKYTVKESIEEIFTLLADKI